MLNNCNSTRLTRQRLLRVPAEYCPVLTIRDLAALGFFDTPAPRFRAWMEVEGRLGAWISRESGSLIVSGTLRRSRKVFYQEIELVTCKSRRARFPFQFRCPGTRLRGEPESACGRATSKLYFVDHPAFGYFACAKCLGLTYLSRLQHQPAKRKYRSLPRVLPMPRTVESPVPPAMQLSG